MWVEKGYTCSPRIWLWLWHVICRHLECTFLIHLLEELVSCRELWKEMSVSDKYGRMLCQHLEILCYHNVVALACNTCPEETEWENCCEIKASLGYMNEFQTSLNYRVRSCFIHNKQTKNYQLSCQGWQTSANLKGAGIEHLSWPLASTPYTLKHTWTHTEFWQLHPILLTFPDAALGGLFVLRRRCAPLPGQGTRPQFRMVGGVDDHPFLRVLACLHIFLWEIVELP